jgi:hypothetical protein
VTTIFSYENNKTNHNINNDNDNDNNNRNIQTYEIEAKSN